MNPPNPNTAGDVISSYPVEDKAQVPDLDPSMFLEAPDDDLDAQPCQVCDEDDNEDVLMYCDGCQKLWHTYCVGLQEVPYGHWFCDNCRAQRELSPRHYQNQNSRRAGHRPSNRRTRGQQRRHTNQHQTNDSSWTQVWQSVWDRINIDLDFPYEDEENAATYIRRHRQRNDTNRREHEAWQRRMQVAELHGAGGRFRETESTLLDHRGANPVVNRPLNQQQQQTPTEENADELLAWHAFDQALASEPASSTSRKKKRKSSTTTSPAEPDAGPAERPIKRLRTNHAQPAPDASASTASATRRRPSPRLSPPSRRFQQASTASGPSFLQSLLKEVEDSSMPNGSHMYRPLSATVQSPPAEQQSPQPSSPALSPLPSNHSSPRAMSATPPPHGHVRPNSPTGLSSSIKPIYPLTEGSPVQNLSDSQNPLPELRTVGTNGIHPRIPLKLAQPTPRVRTPQTLQQSSPPPSRPRSNETSPTRTILSYNAKSDVQKMVSAALKPFYNDQTISKDEYTNVNRDTCHKLYDKIGDFEALDIEGKAKWEKVAGEEVSKAVGALKDIAAVGSNL